jgi:hypothetical protein
MSNKYEHGKFIFDQGLKEKSIDLTEEYTNSKVIKLTPSKNINIYIKEIQATQFTVSKNVDEEVTVNYIVIESEE